MKKIKLTKEVLKRIENGTYYSEEAFIADAKTYISAVKAGRLLMDVTYVTRSGMSRHIRVRSYEGTMRKGYYRSYVSFLEAMGYRFNRDYTAIIINGCGMDMVFHTNYTIINSLHRMGFINRAVADELSQKI